MAHYAFLDENNIVTEVIVGAEEGFEGKNWEQVYGSFKKQICKRTSYNTYEGSHQNGGTPFRKNYAQIGGTYDVKADAFYAPQPFPSWILNQDTFIWEAPVNDPGDKNNKYSWNEETLSWDLIATR